MANDSKPSDEERFFVFTTEENLDLLETCTHWHADGTFKCCPQLFYRVFIIHGVLNNHTSPLVFILLTDKTKAIYARALTELEEINPCLSPTVITVDFEIASINALIKVFPGIKPKGCYFHFAEANWRKLQELGSSTLYQKDETIRETVKCLVSLALIPPSDVYLGFEKVIEEGQENLMPFFEYFETTWLGSSGRLGRRSTPLFHHGLWNQYDAAANGFQKTNNAVEGWHHAFQSGMGFSHATILKFLHYLKREQSLTEN